MNYWLMKSEPNAYSWQDLTRDGHTHWDGVKNYQARNFMMQMKISDLVLMYHSIQDKAIVGIMKVIKEHYPDPSDSSKKFVMVDVEPVQMLTKPVTLADIKAAPLLQNIGLIKQSRLSVMPIMHEEWKEILQMSNTEY